MKQQQKTKRQQKRLTLVDLMAIALLRKNPSDSIELSFHKSALAKVTSELKSHFTTGYLTGKEKDRLKVNYYYHKRMVAMFE